MSGVVRSRKSLRPSLTQPVETARQRRDRRAASGIRRSSRAERKPTQRAGAMPPVMVRGSLQGDMAVPVRKPFSSKKTARVRRRFDLALNVPGAEMRLPSLPVVNFSWRIASGLIAFCMLLCLYFLLFTPFFQVDVLQVEGLQRLTFDDVLAQVSVMGEPVVLVSPTKVQQELRAAFPEFASIQVKVYLPSRIKLVVIERQPVVAWVQDGIERWIDGEGFAFPPRGESGRLVRVEADGFPLPAADSQSSGAPAAASPLLSSQLVAMVVKMGDYLPEGAALAYNQEHGFGWQDPHGWEVFFGKDLDQMEQKLTVYQALADHLINNGIQPTLISMEFLHTPFYRR